ncbi:MAG: leucyl aminopeptidase [Francisellaceae bacterium]
MNIQSVTHSKFASRIIFIFEGERELGHEIEQALERGIFKPKLGNVLPLIGTDSQEILVGLGDRDKLTVAAFGKAVDSAYKILKQMAIKEVMVNTSGIIERGVFQFSMALLKAAYVFDYLKDEKEDYRLDRVDIISNEMEAEKEIKLAKALALGQDYAKDLQNWPANICTTDYMLNEAKKLTADDERFTLSVVDEAKMKELGMGCILAVGQGSSMPSYIVSMAYNNGNKEDKPIVLVGKGLVYDAGGLCLKPWQAMGGMKMDMSGAASVYGALKTIAELDLPVNVIGVVALVENSIDGDAFRPGDVLKSMQGLTVEVLNTDAEGRIALCDTLSYVEQYNPKVVIDIATLTGAMIISLGDDITGLFSNDETLAADLIAASKAIDDPTWHLPLYEPYHDKLKSKIADMKNIGGSAGGSITAALFLSRFTEKYRWAHLDVAGSAMGDFDGCTATGRPVPLLVQYIMNSLEDQRLK